jgi:hypothetical protein
MAPGLPWAYAQIIDPEIIERITTPGGGWDDGTAPLAPTDGSP